MFGVRYSYFTELSASLQEAHVFSLTDGMALEVFVVEGWPGDEVSSFSYFRVISEGFVLLHLL